MVPEVGFPRRLLPPDVDVADVDMLPPTAAAEARRSRRRYASEVRSRDPRVPTIGDGFRLTVDDRRLLVSLARYGVLSWSQICRWFYVGAERRTSVRLGRLLEAGLVVKSSYEWAGSVWWLSREGTQLAADLSEAVPLTKPLKGPPTERLLHRLAVADVGLRYESAGVSVLTEREVRACEQGTRTSAGEVAARLGVKGRPWIDVGGRERWFVVAEPGAEGSIHLPDLVLVAAGQRRAVEVELTPKEKIRAVKILRGYAWQADVFNSVQYLVTPSVKLAMEGYRQEDRWVHGTLWAAGLMDGPKPGKGNMRLVVEALEPTDESVGWRLDMRHVPEGMWVTKAEWKRLRAIWREHPTAVSPAGQVPFLTWWRQVYPEVKAS